jgi:hypothetical protein
MTKIGLRKFEREIKTSANLNKILSKRDIFWMMNKYDIHNKIETLKANKILSKYGYRKLTEPII